METQPKYDSWTLIYRDNKIIGYTHTEKEADDLCKNNNLLSWDSNKVVKGNLNKKELYKTLSQLTKYTI